MQYTIFQIDAFTDNVFKGNPAAVVPLEKWLPDEVMQKIAMENNLSETAFFVPTHNGYHIRWFTPLTEVNLCGHATLASAHVLFNHLGFNKKEIKFESKTGELTVKKEGQFIVLNFPVSELKEIELPQNIKQAFGKRPVKCFKGREDLLFEFNNEADIKNLQPDFQFMKTLDTRGITATAAATSEKYDFVSRFFAPIEGINEDPVTGSAHTMLIPFWAKKLGKTELMAKQISARGGVLHCKLLGERVEIGGQAITYLQGEIFV
ncbi:phenazine biosynthesis protein PhzF family [Tangfeifania diversioriginum]|uniref:Phenazine biosynthesis protein PhzF family n=1 Tax=Tangfeifania diversioriginum TaxID=1168035 RepID=A0A1M6K1U6_9BACT|nr:PhzF family phenazine biosynthesis protein [Tangfeifania diversioriginum]SHJ52918.1 phenazine biosynthesis protein PhzF family [Tangfeifania diversioriginum]